MMILKIVVNYWHAVPYSDRMSCYLLSYLVIYCVDRKIKQFLWNLCYSQIYDYYLWGKPCTFIVNQMFLCFVSWQIWIWWNSYSCCSNVSCEIWLWYPAYAVIDCYLQMHWQVSVLCITHIKCYLVNGYEWKICFWWQMIKGRLLHNLASLWDLFSTTFTYCYHKTQVSVINRSFTWTSLSLQCILPFILFFSF